MKYTYTFNGVKWIDYHAPTANELDKLMKDYALEPSVVEELAHPGTKGFVESLGGILLASFHFPAFQHTHADGRIGQELNFLILNDAVVTVHHDTIDAIHKFRNMAETVTILDRAHDTDSPAVLFSAIMKKMYKSVYHEIEYVERWLDDIEENIFRDREREMVAALSHANRRLLDMKKMIRLHGELLRSLERQGDQQFSDEFARHVRHVAHEHQKISQTIRGDIELVDEFRSTNNALLYTKQNDTIQVLTGLAYVILPVTTVASVFGMRATNGMPFIGQPYDFWIILGIMAICAAAVAIYFKWKRYI